MSWPQEQGVSQKILSLDWSAAEVLPCGEISLAPIARTASGYEITGRPITLLGAWLDMVQG
jgi:hypothetical protein